MARSVRGRGTRSMLNLAFLTSFNFLDGASFTSSGSYNTANARNGRRSPYSTMIFRWTLTCLLGLDVRICFDFRFVARACGQTGAQSFVSLC
ncbi:hypothetical protein BC834DRAFT_884674 [Gloeopeniophorella convolvens]|nr:hypothetical protein BC834DRAFT_884674 [Gloeopeniophorella convolvens]